MKLRTDISATSVLWVLNWLEEPDYYYSPNKTISFGDKTRASRARIRNGTARDLDLVKMNFHEIPKNNVIKPEIYKEELSQWSWNARNENSDSRLIQHRLLFFLFNSTLLNVHLNHFDYPLKLIYSFEIISLFL